MKTQKLKNIVLLISMTFAVFITSCSHEDTENETSGKGKYILVADVEVSSDDSATYILTVDDLMTGTINSKGKGKEIESGTSIYTNNKLFIYAETACSVFSFTDDKITEEQRFSATTRPVAVSKDGNTTVGIDFPNDEEFGYIEVIDSKDGFIIDKVQIPVGEIKAEFEANGKNYEILPTSSTFIDNNKLFVPYILWDLDANWEAPNEAKSYVSVFSYPEMKYLKTITSVDKGGNIGAYWDNSGYLQDEKGDNYLIVPNVGGTPLNRPNVTSSILRIKAGEDKFDDTYEFDIESPEGYRCFTGTYVGNNLAVVRVIPKEFTVDLWNDQNKYFKMAVVNLKTKEFRLVDEIPLHNLQYKTRFLVEDGKVYTIIRAEEGNYIYRIDAATASAEKGAKLELSDVDGIFKTK